jgi:hypothetical protein
MGRARGAVSTQTHTVGARNARTHAGAGSVILASLPIFRTSFPAAPRLRNDA